MKKFKKTCLLSVLFIVLLSFSFTTIALAEVNYLGEICFQMVDNATSQARILEMGLLSYGADHFPLNGKITEGQSVIPVYGAAVWDGKSITITLNASSGLILSATYTLSVDPKTLSGEYTSITHQQLVFIQPPPPGTETVFTSTGGGPLSIVDCP